jgi:hypothetical protein
MDYLERSVKKLNWGLDNKMSLNEYFLFYSDVNDDKKLRTNVTKIKWSSKSSHIAISSYSRSWLFIMHWRRYFSGPSKRRRRRNFYFYFIWISSLHFVLVIGNLTIYYVPLPYWIINDLIFFLLFRALFRFIDRSTQGFLSWSFYFIDSFIQVKVSK